METQQKRNESLPGSRITQDPHHPTHTGRRSADVACPLWEGYGEPHEVLHYRPKTSCLTMQSKQFHPTPSNLKNKEKQIPI
jgi:hypothetical protein